MQNLSHNFDKDCQRVPRAGLSSPPADSEMRAHPVLWCVLSEQSTAPQAGIRGLGLGGCHPSLRA